MVELTLGEDRYMTTIQKTITIPDDHNVNIELSLPKSLPVGAADVTVTISPKEKKHPKTSLLELAGSLANSENLAGDAVSLVRQWRDEW